jgi:putative two-component system response regulator
MKTIFLVDDNMTNLMMGKNALKDKYRTYTMSSAEKMFELLEKIKPDIILLDVLMPQMSGYDAIKILKKSENAYIPVVFVSGNDDAASKEEGMALGALDYIYKPFSSAELQDCIEQRVNSK